MQIINKKGAVLLDVMIAIIFFAIVSIGLFKLLFSDKTGTTDSDRTTVEQIDFNAQKIDFQNQLIEWAKIYTSSDATEAPTCNSTTNCPTAPAGITFSNISDEAGKMTIDASIKQLSFKLKYKVSGTDKSETITFYYR